MSKVNFEVEEEVIVEGFQAKITDFKIVKMSTLETGNIGKPIEKNVKIDNLMIM